MVDLRALVTKVARSLAPVMIGGESGTGKELVARALHEAGPRAGKPFVAVNCGAIPEQLLESEFFGYIRGAFTGATEDRIGFFKAADGGTLFLDEIGDLPLAMQSKLLRAVQERSVRQVGARAEIQVDVRLVAATHRNLAVEVARGRFRQDLYYRLNVIEIGVPPLRDRVQDLPELCEHILAQVHGQQSVPGGSGFPQPRFLSPAAIERLICYDFPGNVRELENILHRALVLSTRTEIGSDELGLGLALGLCLDLNAEAAAETSVLVGGPSPLRTTLQTIHPDRPGEPCTPAQWHIRLRAVEAEVDLPQDLERHLDRIERRLLTRALDEHQWNRTLAGARIGLTLRQIRHRMGRLSLNSSRVQNAGSDGMEAQDTDFGIIDWQPQ